MSIKTQRKRRSDCLPDSVKKQKRKEYLENNHEYRQKARERSKKNYQQNKQARLEKTKERQERGKQLIVMAKDGPCMDCGKRYPHYVMHFHHRDKANKKFSVGLMSLQTTAKILKEINKCDLLCANCHSERTWSAL